MCPTLNEVTRNGEFKKNDLREGVSHLEVSEHHSLQRAKVF